MEKSGRQIWIDASRGFVIVLMLIGHSGLPHSIRLFIYLFHIPFFFILSGYLFDFQKYSNDGIVRLIKKKARVYLLPYIVLSLFNLFVNIPIEIFCKKLTGIELLQSTLKHVIYIIYGYRSADTSPNCTPLWFLVAIFVSTIYLFLLLKIKNKGKRVLICITGVFVCAICNYFKVPEYAIPWHLEVALIGMSFMYIGYEIREKNFLSRFNIYIVISLFSVGIYSGFCNDRIDLNIRVLNNIVLMYVGAIAISYIVLISFKHFCGLSIPVLKRVLEYCKFLGKNTILIMALNYAINTYLGVIATIINIHVSWWLVSIVNIIVVTVLSIVWTFIKKKCPKLAIF